MASKRKQGRRRALPAAVVAVQQRIEQWRCTREKRTHMPEELWQAAASVAGEHGLWAVSRALRGNYECLKRRLGAQPTGVGQVSAAGFIELDTTQLLGERARASTVIELSSKRGAKLTVRLEGQNASVDVPALAAAFWKQNR